MKYSVSLIITFIILVSSYNYSQAQQASSYMPVNVPVQSKYTQTITYVEEEPESGPDTSIIISEIEELENNVIRYAVTREDDDVTNLNFFSHSDSLYTTISSLINTDFFEEFGFDIDLDLDGFVSLIRLSVAQNQSWTVFSQSFTVPIPDAILDLLPDGITFRPDMDVNISFRNTRLPNQTIETPYGMFDTVVFRPGLNLQVVLYAVIVFPIPIPLNILSNYGPELYFAEGFGIVKENLPATRLSVSNSTIGLDQEITTLPGQVLELNSFETNTSVEQPNDFSKTIRLLQNYPNPFNPVTNFRFETEQTGFVTIQVFDIQGKLVREVVQNQLYNAGLHILVFDGSGLASGQYLYQLRFNALDGNSSLQSGSFTLLK